MFEELKTKINEKKAVIGVMGLGYVGLPLAITFSEIFKVIGYDIDTKKSSSLIEGKSTSIDISDDDLNDKLKKNFYPTSEINLLKDVDIIIIAVPTLLSYDKHPDLVYIKKAVTQILPIIKKGVLIILESTTYPGTTEEIIASLLEKFGYSIGDDIFLGYSPERIDPGNKKYNLKNIPKIVSGYDEKSKLLTCLIYETVIDKIIQVKNCKTAEAVKLYENVFRTINISFTNEMAILFDELGVNIWEVISAASTKPYGFMPFYPGPGIGGACIPVNPYYLNYKLNILNRSSRFIEVAEDINQIMPIYAVNLIEYGLNQINKDLNSSEILVMGLAYKKNTDDIRESPSIKIIEELVRRGVLVNVYDPYIKQINTEYEEFKSIDYTKIKTHNYDAIIFLVDHDIFKNYKLYSWLKSGIVIVDCKNIYPTYWYKKNFYSIGVPRQK